MRTVEAPRKDESRAADLETWVRRGCALVVAAVAAYASYVHQRAFALQGGADVTSATLWPLSVDGLLLLATVGLLKPAHHVSRRARCAVWGAFFLGIGVSLAANVAAAPALAWQPILVAGWPPVALLFSVELLAPRPQERERTESAQRELGAEREQAERSGTADERDEPRRQRREASGEGESEADVSRPSTVSLQKGETTAEQIMWDYFQRQRAEGRTPTGAELDRGAGRSHSDHPCLGLLSGSMPGGSGGMLCPWLWPRRLRGA